MAQDDLRFLEYWDEMFNNATHELEVTYKVNDQPLMVVSGEVMDALHLTSIPSNLHLRSPDVPDDAPRDKDEDDDASKLVAYEKADPNIANVTVIGRCGDNTVVRFDSRWAGFQAKKEIREGFVLKGGRLEDVMTGVIVGDYHFLGTRQLRFVGGIPLSGDCLFNIKNCIAVVVVAAAAL